MQNEELNYLEEDEYVSLHPDDIAEELASGLEEFEALRKETDEVFVFEEQEFIKGLGDINYPYTCYRVQGQSTPACKLTAPRDLPSSIRGIYKVDSGLSNVYSRKDTLMIGVQACVWSHFGKSGTATVSGMSSMRFNTTRPSSPTSQHNKGRAFDVKLQGRMLSNGSSYDQMACAYLCLYAVNAGAKRVIFSDQTVVDAVNKATGKNVCLMLGGHKNHIHLDNR